MSLLCGAANRIWRASGWLDDLRFRTALARPERAQEQILRRYVAQNSRTAFGRAHRLAGVTSIAEFRRRVPLSSWEDYSPYVERIMRGENQVLTRGRVDRLVPSSGSTAAAKLIPYTAELRREFNAAISPWIADLYRRRPHLMNGRAYWSISPVGVEQKPSDSVVPIGFDEDSEYLSPLVRPLVDSTLAVNSRVKAIAEMEAFRFETCVQLLMARDLRLISVWHPSFLMLLMDVMEARWEELLDAIGRRGKRGRAEELARCGWRDYGAIWPSLGVISAWGDGHAALPLEALRRRWPGVWIQEKGLLATEAFVTLPYGAGRPVAVRSHFFEFIDEEDGAVRLVHELGEGAVYRVVVTTGGGLYRYQLQDRVQVMGRVRATPSLRFLGKADHVSDWFGEKLSEGFVADVIARLLRSAGVEAAFAMLAPQSVGEGTRYVLYVQSPVEISSGLAEELDRLLCENPHYAYCRRLGQLGPVRIVKVAGDAYERYVGRLVGEGQRLGNIKAMALSPREGWEEVFKAESEVAYATLGQERKPLTPALSRFDELTAGRSTGQGGRG